VWQYLQSLPDALLKVSLEVLYCVALWQVVQSVISNTGVSVPLTLML
jgi:hypothetical protein